MSDGKHVWVDGPDGLEYHCIVCGISKCDDHAYYDSCESYLAERARRFGIAGNFAKIAEGTLEPERARWRAFREARAQRQRQTEEIVVKKKAKAPKKTVRKTSKLTAVVKAAGRKPIKVKAKLMAKPARAKRKATKQPPAPWKYDPSIMLHEVLGILPIFEAGDLVSIQNAVRDRLKALGVVAEPIEEIELSEVPEITETAPAEPVASEASSEPALTTLNGDPDPTDGGLDPAPH